MEADANETLQIRLLKLLLSIIILEDQISRAMGDNSAFATTPPEWDAFNINAQLTSGNVQYLTGKPAVYQTMFLLSVVSMLKHQHMSHMHRHWVAIVMSATPYLHRALTKLTIATVNQLCRNMELLAQLYEHGQVYKSLTYRPDKIPPDHIVTLLEGMTNLCHQCLLDSSQRQQDLSTMCQTLPDPPGGADCIDGGGVMFNMGQAFHQHAGNSKTPSPSRDTAGVDSGARIEARAHMLNILPRIFASLTILWKAIHVSEAKKQKGEPQPWWTLGNPKDVRQCILEFVTPLALHHTQDMLAAVAVVWNERRQRNSSTSAKRVIPVPGEDQLLLVDLVSTIKLLSLDTVIQTVRQIIKQPPQSLGVKSTGSSDNVRQGGPPLKKDIPLEVGLLRFLFAYIHKVEDGLLADTWPLLLNLLKDGLQINLLPPGQFLLLAILNEFIQNIPMFDERKDQKDLQEICQKLLEACSEIAGSSLEQRTFFGRNLAVKPGPQRDVSVEIDEVTTDAEIEGLYRVILNSTLV